MVSKFTYLFSLMEFLWRIFPLLRANRLYAIFNTGLKNLAPSCPRYFLSSSTRSTGFGSVCHEPCPTTNSSFSFFRWREEGATSVFRVPANHLASTFFLPVSGDPSEVTKYKHLFLTVILWWLATVNSNTRIVVILFLWSQWETAWHYVCVRAVAHAYIYMYICACNGMDLYIYIYIYTYISAVCCWEEVGQKKRRVGEEEVGKELLQSDFFFKNLTFW